MQHKAPSPIAVQPREQRILYLILFVLFTSGILILFIDTLTRKTDFFLSLKHWSLVIHGWFSPIIIFLFGYLTSSHLIRAWPTKLFRISGILLTTTLSILLITAPALYYFGNETYRAITWWLHITAGVLLPFVILFHVTERKRRSRKGTS